MSELALKLIREAKEKKLESLNLGNCNITKLPDELFELTHLKELILIGNKNLNSLNNIQYLKKLKLLSISYTLIEDLKPLENIISLKNLFMWETPIIDITSLRNLINIRELSLASTNVINLSPLHDLINLQKLDISFTPVIDLKPLKNLTNLKYIETRGCWFKNPPREITDQGSEAILNYLKQIREQKGTVELYEAKLIIVGEGATGKTTLFEKLKDNNHDVGNTPETHGINIHEGLEFNHKHIGEHTFSANLWDFGGQELQYMTHQFFLTPRALYVLMMDARKESPNLAYWFKIISLLGRDNQDSTEKVRLLLVFNKRGNTTGTPPQYQDQLSYYADSLDVQYLEVDFADNDYRFDALQKAIQQSLVTLPIVKSQLPRLWKVVREDLREEARRQNYITTDRFSEMCSKHGITEEADQWLLSGYLHQLGSLLHFQNDKGLMHFVILSPQWATDGVYTFLSADSISANKGRFTDTAFYQLLAAKGYKRNDAGLVLQLMTKNNFDICYEATQGNYVAAQLLPDNAPVYPWIARDVLQFRYQYPIMPKGLMSRLIVRLSDDIERDRETQEQVVWKKGVVLFIQLKEGNCRVRLREDDAESKSGLRQILIDVMGDKEARKYALRRVRDTVEDLHKKWFRSIKPDEMVPCCCSECVPSANPQLYKLENLLKRRLKRSDHSCDVSGEDLMIQQLLEGVYDKTEIREMEQKF
jgi:internalin A